MILPRSPANGHSLAQGRLFRGHRSQGSRKRNGIKDVTFCVTLRETFPHVVFVENLDQLISGVDHAFDSCKVLLRQAILTSKKLIRKLCVLLLEPRRADGRSKSIIWWVFLVIKILEPC
jgi:hypothetical protein